MKSIFATALLTIGAFASNAKSHGPFEIETGSDGDVEMGTMNINTDWAKTGG